MGIESCEEIILKMAIENVGEVFDEKRKVTTIRNTKMTKKINVFRIEIKNEGVKNHDIMISGPIRKNKIEKTIGTMNGILGTKMNFFNEVVNIAVKVVTIVIKGVGENSTEI